MGVPNTASVGPTLVRLRNDVRALNLARRSARRWRQKSLYEQGLPTALLEVGLIAATAAIQCGIGVSSAVVPCRNGGRNTAGLGAASVTTCRTGVSITRGGMRNGNGKGKGKGDGNGSSNGNQRGLSLWLAYGCRCGRIFGGSFGCSAPSSCCAPCSAPPFYWQLGGGVRAM